MDSVLDDINFIKKSDKSGALELAKNNPGQLRQDFTLEKSNASINKVIVAGMGGSALGPLFAQSWLDLDVPFEVVRDYELPKYVDENTLVITSSYSGNTEETLSCLEYAEKAKASIVSISAGGKLEEVSLRSGHQFIKLPPCPQPRFAAFYSFKAVVSVLVAYGIVGQEKLEEITKSADFLEQQAKNFTQEVPTNDNPAKKLALKLMGKSPVVYSGKTLSSVAYKWKISFNENAKNVAWCGTYPEFNHNEFVGWSSHPVEKSYVVIDLISSFDHPQVKKRFEISDRLLSGNRPKANVVEAQGATPLEQIVWTVTFGDFVSLYLAILNEIDPTPVDLVEKMKKEL